MRGFRKPGVLGITAAALLTASNAWAQCAMCGTAVQGDDPLARGILWSVVFLISLPYVIVGSFVAGLVWLSRRERRRRANSPLHLVGGLGLVGGRKENAK